ncbi:MAG: GerMN domain-containing protein [Clostridia bacterium]|nr:GerMN domain-containing protein [Clostridia bacterium]
MRKFRFIYLIYLIIITAGLFIPAKQTGEQMDRVNLYFVDRQMMRLIQVDYYVSKATPEKEASLIISELLRGRDGNDSIRRMLPDAEDAISVAVTGSTATININMKYLDFYETGKQQEELVVYQLVNSVSSVEGVSRVKFLFDGKEKKDFLGEMDMRESFIPDYCV